jgi:hypothetical protein
MLVVTSRRKLVIHMGRRMSRHSKSDLHVIVGPKRLVAIRTFARS